MEMEGQAIHENHQNTTKKKNPRTEKNTKTV